MSAVEKATTSIYLAKWYAALAHYGALRAYSENLPADHPDEDAAIDAYREQMDAMLRIPAPSEEALALKLSFIRETWDNDELALQVLPCLLQDVRRLATTT